MKRAFDIFFSTSALIILLLPLVIIYFLVLITTSSPAIYWSKRVGRNNKIFLMPKFRTMKNLTPELPTDKLTTREKWITPIGKILRKTSIDEIPQLWCVLKGEMSLIGPRPALHNQTDLIDSRNKLGIQKLRPGITGWAQINGRDTINLNKKVNYDYYYLIHQSFKLEIKIFCQTIYKVLTIKGVL